MELGGFSLPHIALTGAVAAVAAFVALSVAATDLAGGDRLALALLVGVATFLLRLLGNVPALNDDFLPALSVNDLLGFPAALLGGAVYWLAWPSARPRLPPGRAWRWGLILGLVGLVVNVVLI
jgi:hypothetical protein